MILNVRLGIAIDNDMVGILNRFVINALVCIALACIPVKARLIEPDCLYTTTEVISLLNSSSISRELTQWHIHHTWDPSYADFVWDNHLELQQEMRLLHVEQNGWDDIGQHLTLFPDGMWMFGRAFEKDPASIRGWNSGAVAVEMVGNFDVGEDQMSELQRDAILRMTSWVIKYLGLKPCFHRDHPDAGKTCPGSGIDREQFFKDVESGS